MRRALIFLLAAAMLTVGCLNSATDDDGLDDANQTASTEITKVQDRHELNFTIDEGPSNTLLPGPYNYTTPGKSIRVDVSLPPTEGGGAVATGAEMHMGLFLPEIPGCNWDIPDTVTTAVGETIGNEDLPEKCQVPVVADIGPYYSSSTGHSPFAGNGSGAQMEGDTVATEPATRLGGFLIRQLVPHGYAVAQISVYGTGDSGHCMDLMGLSEQLGIDGAATWLGEQPFTNGNLGLTGRSYDGTTPWEATAQGNEYVKTIAPISGLIGQHDLMWRNGSSETRGGSGLLYGIYQTFAPDANEEDIEAISCPDVLTGAPQSVAAWLTGGENSGPQNANNWWAERSGFLEKTIESGWNGSVYIIHGMQDWNVDPHMAFPTHQILEENGYEVKGLYGQWDHAYPDRRSNHEDLSEGYGEEAFPATVRHDWAQDLLEWFDHYLKEEGEKPQLHAEIQDNRGYWRIEDTYPPKDRDRTKLTLANASISESNQLPPEGGEPMVGPDQDVTFQFAPLSEENATRIVGMPTFHVQVMPNGPGGQLFAELRDAETGLRFGHAIMDLRYHQGGDEMQTVTPGLPIIAKMQFFALDTVLPAGHGLELYVASTGEDYLPSTTTNPVQLFTTEDSVLTLPTVAPTQADFFLPPGQEDVLGDGVPPDVDPSDQTGWNVSPSEG